jgi:hypothetical protein
MNYEEPFLPGMQPAEPDKTIPPTVSNIPDKNKDDKVNNKSRAKKEPKRENSGGAVDGCAQCEIYGALGCPRHMKRR